MKALNLTLTVLLSFTFGSTVWGQDSLQSKYDYLLENSETYQQFKVIPQDKLNSFWGEVIDSLDLGNDQMAELQERFDEQEEEIATLNQELEQVKGELAKSQELTDTISFFGIPFSEGSYHALVWVLIAVFAGSGIFAYFLYVRANAVTNRSRRDLAKVSEELEDHRTQAREKQVKLKRELQTALNQLNEKR